MQLLNRANDTPTCYSRAWKTTSTPDLAFSTGDLAHKIERQVLDQLGGSDHRPIKLAINLNLNTPYHKPIPRWNYKRADWSKFVAVSEAKCKAINFQGKRIGETAEAFNKAILRAAQESSPRGARQDYKPYWTQELQDLEEQVTAARVNAEEKQSTEANIAYKAVSAQYRKTLNVSVRDEKGVKKTESLNLD